MDHFTKELDAAIGTLIEYDRLIEKTPRDYGCDVLLYMSDIHMIEAIGNFPGENLTQLAERRGLTKSTVSKLVKKLEKEGLIKRYQFVDNKKETYFELTEQGKKAFEGHYAFHEKRSRSTHQRYRQYTAQQRQLILDFVNMYIEYLKDYI